MPLGDSGIRRLGLQDIRRAQSLAGAQARALTLIRSTCLMARDAKTLGEYIAAIETVLVVLEVLDSYGDEA